jgi:hypothetical protein
VVQYPLFLKSLEPTKTTKQSKPERAVGFRSSLNGSLEVVRVELAMVDIPAELDGMVNDVAVELAVESCIEFGSWTLKLAD